MEHKDLQPKQIALTAPVSFPAVFNGQVVGSAVAPVGSIVTVISIEEGTLMGSYAGGTARVPIQSTDLLQRTLAEMAKPLPAQTPVPPPGMAVATPTPRPVQAADEMAKWDNPMANPDDQNPAAASGGFVHPGLLHTDADFARMKSHIGREPWKSGWEMLIANPHASLSYRPNPVPVVYRGGGSPENYGRLYNDIAAAYACALRWRISGDEAYAQKSIEIMNAWSSTLKQISGSSDQCLAAGIYGYEFANAGEIMRTYHGWKPEEFARFQQMMFEVFYTKNHDFLVRHNGTAIDHYWANWDECNVASVIAIGVLCDKRPIYEEGIDYFKHGKGNGAIHQAVYFIHPGGLGQMQESGRDQGHTNLNISLLGAICQMAWNQGDDLYGYEDNRFLAGCEYVAKYNLGYDVPYRPYANSSFTSPVIAAGGRGDLRPVWELVYNHYAILKGLDAPYCRMMVEKSRPEGGGGNYGPNSGGYDQLGYGTLTYALDPAEVPRDSQQSQ